MVNRCLSALYMTFKSFVAVSPQPNMKKKRNKLKSDLGSYMLGSALCHLIFVYSSWVPKTPKLWERRGGGLSQPGAQGHIDNRLILTLEMSLRGIQEVLLSKLSRNCAPGPHWQVNPCGAEGLFLLQSSQKNHFSVKIPENTSNKEM